MWLKAEMKVNLMCIIMCVCYLPPINSTRCVSADDFMDNLLCKTYEYKPDCDLLFICGDFNAHCGDKQDFIAGVDDLMQTT